LRCLGRVALRQVGANTVHKIRSRQWRRGDSNPKRTETELIQHSDNSATDCNEKSLKDLSEKQSHDNSERFKTVSQHQLGANMVRVNGDDPDLEELIQSWPRLPEHIKEAIKALIQGQNKP